MKIPRLSGRVGVPPAGEGILPDPNSEEVRGKMPRTAGGTPTLPGNALFLYQPWVKTPEPGFQPAHASLSWSASHLHVQAVLEDRHIISQSTAHNQSLHLLGDTLEVFLMLPGATEYYELHVSPHNHRTLLRWPAGGIEKVRAGKLTLESFRQNPDAFTSQARLQAHGWEVDFGIPARVLGVEQFTIGQPLLISTSRYDYTDLETPPILSTTATHLVKNFHRIEDWLSVELA